MLKGQTLTLVDRDGPCQTQRILGERAGNLGLNGLLLGVDGVFRILPDILLHINRIGVVRTFHGDRLLADRHDMADLTIIIFVFGRGIVFDKHHLRALFQHQIKIGRIVGLREVAFYRSRKRVALARELQQFVLVVTVCQPVVGRKADIAVLRLGDKSGRITVVEPVHVLACRMAVAHMIEDINKGRVLLTVDVGELDGDVIDLPQRLAAEEIRSVIITPEHLLVLRRHHGRELLQVAYHEQLHTPERLRTVTETTEHGVDGIEEVGTHHTDLIDDKHVKGGDDASFGFGEVVAVADRRTGDVRRGRQLKERMDRHAAGIDSRHTRRGHNDHPLR